MAEASPATATAAPSAASSTNTDKDKADSELDGVSTVSLPTKEVASKAKREERSGSPSAIPVAEHRPDFFKCTPPDIAKAVAERVDPDSAKSKKKGKVRGVLMFKKVVAKKKNFVSVNGFELDGAYITKKPYLVAMGYPAHGIETMYRNHWQDIKDYLDRFHTNRYMLFNLCGEPDRKYDHKLFDGRVQEFGFQDHHPPPLALFLPFCQAMHEFLCTDEQNAAIIHCKAGKGRTGVVFVYFCESASLFGVAVMICAYLIWKYGKSAFEAIQIYGMNRTRNGKGVTIPSQRRYLHYWDAACGNPSAHFAVNLFKRKTNVLGVRSGVNLSPQPVFLSHITLRNGCPLGKRKESYYVTMLNDYWNSANPGKDKPTYTTDANPCTPAKLECPIFSDLTIKFNPPLRLVNDVKVHFYNKSDDKSPIFHCWFNTCFASHDPLVLEKIDKGLGMQIDGLHKSKKGSKYADDMTVEFHFQRAPQAEDDMLVPSSVKKLMDKAEAGLLRAFKTAKGQQALMDEAKHYSSIEEAKARLIQVARRTAGQRAMARLKIKYGKTPPTWKLGKHSEAIDPSPPPEKDEEISEAEFHSIREKVRRMSTKNREMVFRKPAGGRLLRKSSYSSTDGMRKPRDSYPPSDGSRYLDPTKIFHKRSRATSDDDISIGKLNTKPNS